MLCIVFFCNFVADLKIKDMTKEDIFIGKRVKVSPEATGCGAWQPGTIDNIETFMRRLLVSVTYDHLAADGTPGITISNIGLIEPLN